MSAIPNSRERGWFWSVPWWELCALVRGVSLAVLVGLELFFARDLGSHLLLEMLANVLLACAVIVNAAFGGAEVFWSLSRALMEVAINDKAVPEVCRHFAAALVRAMCAALPVIVFLGGTLLQIPDRSFIWRHSEQLEAVLNGGDAMHNGFESVDYCGSRTMIHVSNLGWLVGYWLIYDEHEPPADELARDLDPCLSVRVMRVDHVVGPWYCCLVD